MMGRTFFNDCFKAVTLAGTNGKLVQDVVQMLSEKDRTLVCNEQSRACTCDAREAVRRHFNTDITLSMPTMPRVSWATLACFLHYNSSSWMFASSKQHFSVVPVVYHASYSFWRWSKYHHEHNHVSDIYHTLDTLSSGNYSSKITWYCSKTLEYTIKTSFERFLYLNSLYFAM